MDFCQKMQRCNKYIEALEEEHRKIQVFKRELPLCLDLVTQAIEACRRELSRTTTEHVHGQPECSEQTTGECGPILEEFIPIKPTSSSNDEEEEEEADEDDEQESHHGSDDKSIKSDWLRSVQLWNQSPDPPREEHSSEKEMAMEVINRNDEAFRPPYNNNHHHDHYQVEKSESGKNQRNENSESPVTTAAATATATTSERSRKKEVDKDGKQRKQRLCWSQELHRRFLSALRQLGGAHAATPKQIRELMKVDGLTNDEVKSHLQKYRLHTKRTNQKSPSSSGNPLTPHFLVVRGVWIPQPDYSMADTMVTAATARIYEAAAAATPSSTTPLQWSDNTKFESLIPEERLRCYNVNEDIQNNSPASSSSVRNEKKC